jgi:hypothetical protein
MCIVSRPEIITGGVTTTDRGILRRRHSFWQRLPSARGYKCCNRDFTQPYLNMVLKFLYVEGKFLEIGNFFCQIKIVQNLVGFPSCTHSPQLLVNLAINSYSNLFSYHAHYIQKAPKLVAFYSSVPRTLLQALMCLWKSVLRSYRDKKKPVLGFSYYINLQVIPKIIKP